jgi:hypothetical protein
MMSYFSDSLEAMQRSAGCAVKKVVVVEPPEKKVTEPPVRVLEGDFSILARRCQLFSHRRRRSSRSGWLDLPPPQEVAYLIFLPKEMDFPNLEIGLSVLIIMRRLWFGRRTMIIGMVYPWIGLWMVLLRRRPWLFRTPWRKIFCERR